MDRISLAFVVLLFVGCENEDPSSAALTKGEFFDLERTEGTVTGKSVRYFSGNANETKDKKGQPYYIIDVKFPNSVNSESICGVSQPIFDSVEVNDKLPKKPTLTLRSMASVDGKIVDKQVNLEKSQFFVVVDDGIHTPRTYTVDAELYYRKLDIGTRLPMQWDGRPENSSVSNAGAKVEK